MCPLVRVSSRDLPLFKSRCWYIGSGGYLTDTRGNRLHTLIMKPDRGFVVDHISGDKLDNRRDNLRIVSQKENMRNMQIHREGRIPGVRIFETKFGRFQFRIIKEDGSRHSINFPTLQEAQEFHTKLYGRLHGCVH